MSFILSAFIGNEAAVECAAALTGQHRVSRLDRKLHMVELSRHPRGRESFSDRFYLLTPQLVSVATVTSAVSDIAYIEVTFFGGDGSQACMVWRDGEVIFGPLRADHDEPPFPPMKDWPINQALRFFGVQAGETSDEFDAVGLWRFR